MKAKEPEAEDEVGVSQQALDLNGEVVYDQDGAYDVRDALDEAAEKDQSLRTFLDGADRWQSGNDWDTMREEANVFLNGGTAPIETRSLLKHVALAPENAPELYRGISVDATAKSFAKGYKAGSKFDLPLSSFTSEEYIAARYATDWGKQTNVVFTLQKGSSSLNIAPLAPDLIENMEWISTGRFEVTYIEVLQGEVRVEIKQIARLAL